MDKNSFDSDWIVQAVPVLFAATLAGLGGVIRYLNRVDRDGVPFRIFSLLVESVTSAFVGIVTFMLCDSAGWGWEYTAAAVAITGHMGGRAIMLLENVIIQPLIRRFSNENRKTDA